MTFDCRSLLFPVVTLRTDCCTIVHTSCFLSVNYTSVFITNLATDLSNKLNALWASNHRVHDWCIVPGIRLGDHTESPDTLAEWWQNHIHSHWRLPIMIHRNQHQSGKPMKHWIMLHPVIMQWLFVKLLVQWCEVIGCRIITYLYRYACVFACVCHLWKQS